MKKFINEFKSFIMRGSVIDMAVGIVVGAAFTTVINSVVKDIINPVIGFILAGIDFANLKAVLASAEGAKPEIAITYGNLINAIINFIIVAFVLFIVLKIYNKAKLVLEHQQEATENAKPATPSDNELLAAILDELKKR